MELGTRYYNNFLLPDSRQLADIEPMFAAKAEGTFRRDTS